MGIVNAFFSLSYKQSNKSFLIIMSFLFNKQQHNEQHIRFYSRYSFVMTIRFLYLLHEYAKYLEKLILLLHTRTENSLV